jgi:RNA polymerase sigma factor (sigma-70 family)
MDDQFGQNISATTDDSSRDFIALLEQIDPYIVMQGEAFGRTHSYFAHPAILDLEIKEVIQRVRIKLWEKLQEQHTITHYKTYIKSMVRNAFIDEMRKKKHFLPLLTDEYGEIEGTTIYNEYTLDPASAFEQRADADELINTVVEAIAHLPEKQQFAMICRLRERVDDLIQLDSTLQAHEINAKTIVWPSKLVEKQLLKASLPPARKKIMQHLQSA